MNEIKLNK